MKIRKILWVALKIFVYGIFIPIVFHLLFLNKSTFYASQIYLGDAKYIARYYMGRHFDNLEFITLAYFLFCVLFFLIKRFNYRKWIVIAFLVLPALFFVISYLYRWHNLTLGLFYSWLNATYYLLFGLFFIAFLLLERKTTLKAVFKGGIKKRGAKEEIDN